MNRFSSDIDVIDDRFPRTFRMIAMMGSVLLGTLIVLLVTTPISVFAILPLFVLYAVTIVSDQIFVILFIKNVKKININIRNTQEQTTK